MWMVGYAEPPPFLMFGPVIVDAWIALHFWLRPSLVTQTHAFLESLETDLLRSPELNWRRHGLSCHFALRERRESDVSSNLWRRCSPAAVHA